MADSPAKADGGSERKPAGYKSWKKKYRKMRIVFDQKMHECEELHKQEAKAASTVKRLAIENEYVCKTFLDLASICHSMNHDLTSHSSLQPTIRSPPRGQQLSTDPPRAADRPLSRTSLR